MGGWEGRGPFKSHAEREEGYSLPTTQPFSAIQLGSICAWVGCAPEPSECRLLAIRESGQGACHLPRRRSTQLVFILISHSFSCLSLPSLFLSSYFSLAVCTVRWWKVGMCDSFPLVKQPWKCEFFAYYFKELLKWMRLFVHCHSRKHILQWRPCIVAQSARQQWISYPAYVAHWGPADAAYSDTFRHSKLSPGEWKRDTVG